MFEGFEPITVSTQSEPPVSIFGLKSSPSPSSADLPALLLLHGFPQTHHMWNRVAPKLTSKYNVVMLDLRGYGASSKPADVASYAKSAMARDCAAAMEQLGFQSFYVCGHDRGARVAHKLCVDFPGRVRRAVLLDICPTLAMFEATDFAFARAYFHWFLLIQPEPLPEMVLASNPRRLAQMLMGGRQLGGPQGAEGLCIFDLEAFEHYVGGLSDPEAVHAMCNDYRAAATLDMEEQRQDIKDGRQIQCPLLVLWAKNGVVEKCFDAVKEWRAVTKEGVSVEGHAVESGHYIPEEVPDAVVSAIIDFMK